MSFQYELRNQGHTLAKYKIPFTVTINTLSLIVFYMSHKDLGLVPKSYQPYLFGCIIIIILGSLFRLLSSGYSRIINYDLIDEKSHTINSSGLHSTTRNPNYFFAFVIGLGIALLSMNIWYILFYASTSWLFYERVIYAEEMYLCEKYCSTFTSYAEKVPAFFPNPFKWKRSLTKFNWKNYKTTNANLFLF